MSISLTEVFAGIPDPRGRQGQRHPLVAVLSLVSLGVLMGKCSLEAIAQLGRDYGTPLAHALGFKRGKTPAKSTLSVILRALAPDEMETCLTRWISSRLSADENQLSLDGKTLRGSRDGEIPGQHLVAAYVPHVEAVLAQIRVDAKTNEHKAALQLLGILPVKGRVVVGDAMFCQRDICKHIVEQGGDYVLMVKDNQLGLKTDIAAGFAYEKTARSMAAAFSPGRGNCRIRSKADDHDGEQGTRACRKADVADDVHPDSAFAMGRPGTRL